MPSPAFTEWQASGLTRLAELEGVHADARGTKPGRRWGTEQLNRSLFVALVAQFQTYCRDLHDDAIEVHVANGRTEQSDLLRRLMSQRRRLDTQTPRTSVLASDFLRVGFNMVDELKAKGSAVEAALGLLDVAVDFRNAVVHGNETQIGSVVATGRIKATMTSYRAYRRALTGLATTMDSVTAGQLASLLMAPPPW